MSDSEYEDDVDIELVSEEEEQEEEVITVNKKKVVPPKVDKRCNSSGANLAKARARKAEWAAIRKIENAKKIITEHIIEEEESDDDTDESDEEEEVIRKVKRRGKASEAKELVTKSTQLSKRKTKNENADERIQRLENLLVAQLTAAKKAAKKSAKATRKPKTAILKIEQQEPKKNDKLQSFAKATLLDMGL